MAKERKRREFFSSPPMQPAPKSSAIITFLQPPKNDKIFTLLLLFPKYGIFEKITNIPTFDIQIQYRNGLN